ncbi:hypothetical protein [Pseudoalteromonas luteoviolacea]|uniref:Uncharacterized protein n=1 Tax=Pseudoalteromonas luteoviolacea DSM 6061 TaxID=1365250 RepID=A0A166WVM7_9GAMM|nr:hypothetical protein [Pseudoalteromonas luteoviolacea]KZN38130.1 hypothetical protein N475_15995 [Pseudoalteromonas luteoviolacea DSM 6061]KZN54384.1 hypothetical protein N474_01335 [Pseudoalteromonas luteoviolacea CPMOR-2]MBE0388847.1 hypothetical protein [Pseudoalteromonas luteoviolacea DSM 6061]
MKLKVNKRPLKKLNFDKLPLDKKLTPLVGGAGLSNGPTQECESYYHCDSETP